MENMKNKQLPAIITKALPALSGSSLTYNAEKNLYLTLGYTSNAGNTYFQAVRCTERLAVYFDIGKGYARTFLNGIKMFCWDGQKARLIAQRYWGGANNWVDFSEYFAKQQCILMLKDYLAAQYKAHGQHASERQLQEFSCALIEETQRKLTA